MTDSAPNPELLSSLGRLVRGLSALFWGLPLALVVCVQTAKGEWLLPLGIFPSVLATSFIYYALGQLSRFQRQERVWTAALERAKFFAVINVGLSPFLYWWNKLPSHPFYNAILYVIMLSGLMFLFALNPLLWRLTAMLPDEALRTETRLFTTVNRYLLAFSLLMLGISLVVARVQDWPTSVLQLLAFLDRRGLWFVLASVLLPLAMTMALIWKIKEVILASVFGNGVTQE